MKAERRRRFPWGIYLNDWKFPSAKTSDMHNFPISKTKQINNKNKQTNKKEVALYVPEYKPASRNLINLISF